MPPISPSSGPVAVTGASGYIGSWICYDLMMQGYNVRACVRDTSNPKKVAHLQAMNEYPILRGTLTLYQADLLVPGSYDNAFRGAAGVIHSGAAVGFNKETPQEVYDGCFTQNEAVLSSVAKSGSVKRIVFTSSFAAVAHPAKAGYVFTEKDWCTDNRERMIEKGLWDNGNGEVIKKSRDIAYALAKARSEKLLYKLAAENGTFEAMTINPLHVIGPVMCENHDQPFSWQNHIRFMMNGKNFIMFPHGRMLWNCVDVRDTARAHRLCLESTVADNGSRYILGATDRSMEMFTWQLQAKLQSLFPQLPNIGGEEMKNGKPTGETYDSPRSYCLLAKEELGLKTYTIEDTLRDTGLSYMTLGLIKNANL